MLYYLDVQTKEILPFATAGMDLESIMVSEISLPEKDKYHMVSLNLWNLMNKINEQTK